MDTAFIREARLMGSARRLRLPVLPSYSRQEWLWLVCPVAVLLALIVGMGPALQDILARTISSREPALYDALFAQSVPQLPSLSAWMASSLNLPYPAIALLVSILSLKRTTLIRQTVAVFAWFCVLLSASDIIVVVLMGGKYSMLPVSLVSNLLGSVVIAAVYYGAGATYISLHRVLRGNRIERRFYPALFMVVSGICCSAIIHTAFVYLYQATPVLLSVTMGPTNDATTSITVVTKDKLPEPSGSLSGMRDRERSPQFTFLPRANLSGDMLLTSPRGRVQSRWQTAETSAPADVKIRAYVNCPGIKIGALPPAEPVTQLEGVISLGLMMSEGVTIIRAPVDGYLYISGTDYSDFSFGRAEDRSDAEIGAYLPLGSSVTYGTNKPIKYIIGTALVANGDNTLSPAPKFVTLQVDGKIERSRIEPMPSFEDADAPLACRAMNLSDAGGNNAKRFLPAELRTNGVYISFLVEVYQSPNRTSFSMEPQNVSFTGLNGWISLDSIPEAALQSKYLGSLEQVLTQKGWDRLEIDGKTLGAGTGRLSASGKFQASYDHEGKLSVDGTADALWRNGERSNLTRWELLPIELKVTVITLFIAIMGGAVTLAHRARGLARSNLLAEANL